MKKITRKEEEVLNLFWEKGPMFVRELLLCYPDPKPHFNTISTMVRSLEEKAYVAHETLGNSYRYHAVISKEHFSKGTLKNVIDKYFNHSYLDVVSMLVKEEKLSESDIQALITQVRNKK